VPHVDPPHSVGIGSHFGLGTPSEGELKLEHVVGSMGNGGGCIGGIGGGLVCGIGGGALIGKRFGHSGRGIRLLRVSGRRFGRPAGGPACRRAGRRTPAADLCGRLASEGQTVTAVSCDSGMLPQS